MKIIPDVNSKTVTGITSFAVREVVAASENSRLIPPKTHEAATRYNNSS